MSTDTDARPAPAPTLAREGEQAAELPRLPGRRDPKWIALGVVALCLGALLSYVVYARVASETAVVSVVTTIYRGEVLEADDLTTVRLQGGALPGAVPASELDALVGQRAVYDLPAGSVVAGTSVAATTLPADGRSVVGILLPGGTAPQGLLLPSSPIRLVALPPASSSTATEDQLAGKTYAARVVSTAPAPDGTSLMVDVDVPQAQAASIALLAASSRLAVVRDSGR